MTDETAPPTADETAAVLHSTTDAAVWATEFDRLYPDRRPDSDTMLGWFANAIEVGRMAESAAADAVALDAVYRDRNLVVQAFAAVMEDEGWHVAGGVDPSEPEWPVLYIETSAGQVSWHIPKAERIYEPPDRTASFGPMVWDGHTDGEKFDRLRSFVASTPKGEPST